MFLGLSGLAWDTHRLGMSVRSWGIQEPVFTCPVHSHTTVQTEPSETPCVERGLLPVEGSGVAESLVGELLSMQKALGLILSTD